MKTSAIPALLMLSILASGLWSCGSRSIYREFREIPDYSWERDRTISFQTELKKEDGALDIDLELRHASYFPYTEMAVVFRIIGPDGSVRSAEHVIPVRDEKGDFLAKGMGDLWDLSFPVHEGLTLNQSGTYTFEIDNVMPRVRVAGIMDVGIRISKSKQPLEETGN